MSMFRTRRRASTGAAAAATATLALMCPALAQADDGPTWQTHRLPGTGEQYFRNIGPPAQVMPPGKPADAHHGEPQVTLSGDGRVYVNAFGGRSWRSDDDGRTFQELAAWGVHTPGASHATTQDVDVAFSDAAEADGRRVVHSVSHNLRDGSSLIYARSLASKDADVERRMPVGEAWQDVQVFAPHIDRPYVATSRSNVYVSWTDFTLLGRRQLWFRTSPRNGELGSFDPPVNVFASADAAEQLDRVECFNRHGEFVVVARTGQPPLLHIPYTSGGPNCDATGRSETLTEYRIATSADHGATWTHQVVPPGSATGALGFVFPSLAGSADGDLYAVWAERTGTGRKLRVQAFSDGAWLNEPATVDVPGQVDAVMPRAVAGKHGVDLLWYSARDCVIENVPTTCWVTMHGTIKHLDHVRQSVTLRQVSPGDVYRGRICTDGFTCAPLPVQDGSRNRFLEFLGLARGADGALHASWNSTLDEGYPVAVYYGRLDAD